MSFFTKKALFNKKKTCEVNKLLSSNIYSVKIKLHGGRCKCIDIGGIKKNMMMHMKKIRDIYLCLGITFLITLLTSYGVIQGQELSEQNEEIITEESADSQEIQNDESLDNSTEVSLPVEETPSLSVKELRINGNTLISTEILLQNMPFEYIQSDESIPTTENQNVYDLSILHEIAAEPGIEREVPIRTIQGFIQYVLSEYQALQYSGIYVYMPQNILSEDGILKDGILLIEVIEATVNDVQFRYYNAADQNELEYGRLKLSAIKKWSPLKIGQVANQKKLDNFVNLLNLNPDRYTTVGVSAGAEPNTLDFEYKIYETNPWHRFVILDNSGTNDRQWSPRTGIINTNLLGYDDKLTTVYQAKPDSTIDENYSIFSSYDIPVMGPKLRLNLFVGHSEFDINPESGTLDFLGRGTFYGGLLRYNLLQKNGWFFNVTGSLSHERSKVTPSLFPAAASDIEMDILGLGAELNRSSDVSNTNISFNIQHSLDTSSRRKFNLARTDADTNFNIYTLSANHNRYLDKNNFGQLKSNIKWVMSSERLVPAKMTSFGGLYSVRGYDEYEIVADGGILASIQYEFNWLRYKSQKTEEVDTGDQEESQQQDRTEIGQLFTKITPLVFIDFGRTNIKDPVAGENDNETLWSLGIGSNIEIKNNFTAAVYYGYPMESTDDTRRGKGRLNVSFMLRW